MKTKIRISIIFILIVQHTLADDKDELTEKETEYLLWSKNIWDSLDRQSGLVYLQSAGAQLNIPDSFYFLNAKDANKVLIDVWGNPPGLEVLGMIFPSELTPFDENSWAVTIEYEQDGYISDNNVDEIDYAELLTDMQQETNIASQERVNQGYESIELVGWAAEPFYDSIENKLHWAKEIKFAGQPVNTLNYNIRVLGRKGVLVLNFIASIEQKSLIESKLDVVLGLAEFEQGARYADFDPEIDQVAAYGLGALVAGKVIAKTGFLGLLLVFLKKFGIFIIAGIGMLFKKRFFSKK